MHDIGSFWNVVIFLVYSQMPPMTGVWGLWRFNFWILSQTDVLFWKSPCSMSYDNTTEDFVLKICSRMLMETYGNFHHIDDFSYVSLNEQAVETISICQWFEMPWHSCHVIMMEREVCIALACQLTAWICFRIVYLLEMSRVLQDAKSVGTLMTRDPIYI